MNEKIQDIKEKVLSFTKNIEGKNKNILFIVAGIIVLIPLTLWLLSTDNSKSDLSQSFENLKKEENAQQKEYSPPKLENPFKLENKEHTQENNMQEKKETEAEKQMLQNPLKDLTKPKEKQSKEEFASFAKDQKDLEVENNLKEISNSNLNQEETIKQIAKTQKPNDMIIFLKEIQNDITIQKNTNTFKYDLKEYKEGDNFLDWFIVEAISHNFIRFKDQDYAYNLRFLGD